MATSFVPWVKRAPSNPLLSTSSHEVLAAGVAHPCLIRVPDWEGVPADSYLLYVSAGADGSVITAVAESPEGPWTVDPTPIDLDGGLRPAGAADVHVDHVAGVLRMYLSSAIAGTVVATSRDGRSFEALGEVPGPALLRTWRWGGAWWAVNSLGRLLRSDDGLVGWEDGGRLLGEGVRSVAVLVDDDVLRCFFTEAGDCPERILHGYVGLEGDWRSWTAGPSGVVLEPEESYEGIEEPLLASKRGPAGKPVRQLRHPSVYVEGQQRWLLYNGAGEQSIAIARFVP